MKRSFQLLVLLVAIVAMLSEAAILNAQPPEDGQRGRERRGRGQRGGGDGYLGQLLRNKSIQKELELVDEQIEKLKHVGKEMSEKSREMFSGMRDLSEKERREKRQEMRKKMGELSKQAREQVDSILMPNQQKRYREIMIQEQMRRGGLTRALRGKLAEELGVTDEQRKKMQEAAKVINKELQEKMKKARDEAREKLLETLTSEQRAKLKEMVGEEYKPEPRMRRQRDGNGGQNRERDKNNGRRRDSADA